MYITKRFLTMFTECITAKVTYNTETATILITLLTTVIYNVATFIAYNTKKKQKG